MGFFRSAYKHLYAEKIILFIDIILKRAFTFRLKQEVKALCLKIELSIALKVVGLNRRETDKFLSSNTELKMTLLPKQTSRAIH